MVRTIAAILNESTSVPKRSPKTFHCRNLFMFPIICAVIVQHGSHLFNSSQGTELIPFRFCYHIFLCAFPLHSAALIFIVASYYTSKPVSAIPCSIFKHLFITHCWVSLIMVIYNGVFLECFVLVMVANVTQNAAPLLVALFVEICLIFADDVSLCQLAGVVSGLEPVYGFTAMEKCYVLLKARNPTAAWLVFTYPSVYGSIGGVSTVVHGGLDCGVYGRYMVGGYLGGWLVVVISVGLMV
ncbi:hypothetical protein RHGRI_015814 [Rhododendron griersonianum]|uniref:Uncharacterized protein n=1 Tax=Rhododendron griersonianum TaxID=479676 RepID=A0AAV6JNR7_9ERIC|nr:hypothetical protein RHGRI_015814 [Rhododendron griersonianum]